MRTLLMIAAFALAFPGADALAQDYPSKPVRLIVGFAPGGAADFVARILAEPIGRLLGQSIVVENRPGAGSSIAAEYVAKSAPDGYTVLIASPSSISVNPAMMPKLGYNPKTDLMPVSLVSTSPLVVAVNPGTGIHSIRELIAAAKSAPGKFNYASSGNGSAPHLSGLLFSRLAGVRMEHVPFKGGGPAVQSVLAGDTQITFATPPSVMPLVHSGRLRALAVTSRARSPLVPDLPGMEEAGLAGYEISFWYGFFVPTGTPANVVRKLFEATTTVLQRPEIKQALARGDTEAIHSRSPEEFGAFLVENEKFWVQLVKDMDGKTE